MHKTLARITLLLTICLGAASCKDTITYAEQQEQERASISTFIADSAINVISKETFEANGKKTDVTKNQFVSLDGGLYLQIVHPGEEGPEQAFNSGDKIAVRYLEKRVKDRELTCFNVPLPEAMDAVQLYALPAIFQYIIDERQEYAYGKFTEMDNYWAKQYNAQAVPKGWIDILPYIHSGASVRIIVPHKLGHQVSNNAVNAYYYDIKNIKKV